MHCIQKVQSVDILPIKCRTRARVRRRHGYESRVGAGFVKKNRAWHAAYVILSVILQRREQSYLRVVYGNK